MKKETKVRSLIKKMVREIMDEGKLAEKAKRDYKDEYKKFQSSDKSKKYRAELNKYNRQKGTYGNGDGKDASHKGGKIVGFEKESVNRGRAEKSRLKKEGKLTERNEGYFKQLLTRMIDDFDRAEKTWKTTDQKKNKQIWSYLKKGKTNLQFAKDEFLGEGKLTEVKFKKVILPNDMKTKVKVSKMIKQLKLKIDKDYDVKALKARGGDQVISILPKHYNKFIELAMKNKLNPRG